MATNQVIGNIAIKGIKNLVFRDKVTKAVVGDIKYLTDISLSDELASDFLRGGYNNPKLLTIYGDRETTFTGNSATMSTELLSIMTSTKAITKTVEEDFVEDIALAGGKLTLQETPIPAYLTIFPLDANGKKGEKLASSDYTIADKAITIKAPASGVVKYVVYYRANVQVQSMEVADTTPKVYEASALMVVQEVETKETYTAWIRIPSASIQPKYSIAGKNEASAPDPVEVVIDCLMDSAFGYPYAIDFKAQ